MPEGFRTSWHANPSDSGRGVIAVHVPDQDQDRKPFLIAHSLRETGKNLDMIFGFAQRLGAITNSATKEQLQTYLGNGRGWDPIVQKLDAILAKIDAGINPVQEDESE